MLPSPIFSALSRLRGEKLVGEGGLSAAFSFFIIHICGSYPFISMLQWRNIFHLIFDLITQLQHFFLRHSFWSVAVVRT